MSGLELVFTISAAIGGGLFVVRMILQFVGSVADAHTDVTGGDLDLSHSDISFKLLSFQGLTAFFMMFGLAGRALLLDSKTSALVAIAGASVAGLFSVWVIAQIFRFMGRLQSSGKVDIQAVVGHQGTIYLTVPAGGVGQVHVSVTNRLHECQCVAEDKQEIKTGAVVKVLRVTGDNMLVVAPV
jgi:membrane protein implicated in regulation of membrane protease activity